MNLSFKKQFKKEESKTKDRSVPDKEIGADAKNIIQSIFEPESFTNLFSFKEGSRAGFGKIGNHRVFLLVLEGKLGEKHSQKLSELMSLALKTGCPLIILLNSIHFGERGNSPQPGIYKPIFSEVIKANGIIPVITIVKGCVSGEATYIPALSDFVFIIGKNSKMYFFHPSSIEAASGEKISEEELGGFNVHMFKTGAAHFVCENEELFLRILKKIISYLPPNSSEQPPCDKSILAEIFNKESAVSYETVAEGRAYDIREIIKGVFDNGSFIEMQEKFAPNIVVGMAKLSGYTIGVIANQPISLNGALDIDSSNKIISFVKTCDKFNVPLINFIDTPGYSPEVEQEYKGVAQYGAKLLYTFHKVSIPKITLILRKAFGPAYTLFASKKMNYDLILAWPSAILGSNNFYLSNEKEILSAKELLRFNKIDMIVQPYETREKLIKIIQFLSGKKNYFSKK